MRFTGKIWGLDIAQTSWRADDDEIWATVQTLQKFNILIWISGSKPFYRIALRLDRGGTQRNR